METEQSLIKSESEKKLVDESGHSETILDLKLNKATTKPQTIGVFLPKKKEKVLLENK